MVTGAQENGSGAVMGLALLVAEELGMRPEDVLVRLPGHRRRRLGRGERGQPDDVQRGPRGDRRGRASARAAARAGRRAARGGGRTTWSSPRARCACRRARRAASRSPTLAADGPGRRAAARARLGHPAAAARTRRLGLRRAGRSRRSPRRRSSATRRACASTARRASCACSRSPQRTTSAVSSIRSAPRARSRAASSRASAWRLLEGTQSPRRPAGQPAPARLQAADVGRRAADHRRVRRGTVPATAGRSASRAWASRPSCPPRERSRTRSPRSPACACASCR